MSLESPRLALVVGVGALVVLFLLDRLRRRPVVLLVASLELFPRNAEVESQAEKTKSRAWRDLILRGLAALLLALAAGGPRLANVRSAGRRVRVLIDRSASMEAVDQGTTRLELARAELARALSALAPEDEVELHLDPRGDDEPARTLSPAEARAFVPAIVRVPSTVGDRIDLVAAAASARTVPLLVVTDRDVAFVASDDELAQWVHVAVVGSPQKNVGLTAFASRREASGEERLLVAANGRAAVELVLGATRRTLAVDGSAIAPVPSGIERAEAKLETAGGDALASDDHATALRRVDAPLRVALDPTLGKPLEAALRAVPGTDVQVGDERSDADVFVRRWDDRDVADAPRGFTVFFAPGAPPPPERPLKCVDTRLDASGVSLTGIDVPGFRRDVPTSIAVKPVLTDGKGATIIGVGPRVAWIGFEPPKGFQDGWAKHESFPRFFAYLLEDVRALEPEDLVAYPTGRPLLLPRPADAKPGARLVVTDPRGRAQAVDKTFTPVEPGVHEVRAEGGTQRTRFAAALLDARTSDLSTTRARPFAAPLLATLSARPATRADETIAWILALVALLLAGVAWSLDKG